VNRLRNRLIVVFLAATILPLIVTGLLVSSLLELSLSYSTTEELQRLSQLLEKTGRDYYFQAREALQKGARSGEVTAELFRVGDQKGWPPSIREFWESREAERFALAGARGYRLDYMVRGTGGVDVYSRPLGNVHMEELAAQIRESRQLIGRANDRDLRRGLTTVLIILMVAVWLVSFGSLVYVADRMSRPIQQLTEGLSELASGNPQTRIETTRNDEIGRAITAFNHTAVELRQSRERLVYLTQIASWQALARKMAHELKNSLTPIRLTVEEIRARQSAADRQFMEQAVRIVVNEVESLERRVRAFSEFSSEPEIRLGVVDANALVSERVSFLKPGHPDTRYSLDLDPHLPFAMADSDRVKGILTNLLENAAEAAGAVGEVLVRSEVSGGKLHIEVHDSGGGLSDEARRTLFEPTISFKARGMGLGLSISRKDALMCGGDLTLVDGRLTGAAFRLILPMSAK
jgi:nitrogen fixation/metabolism regulation signal transduction histidine kinase